MKEAMVPVREGDVNNRRLVESKELCAEQRAKCPSSLSGEDGKGQSVVNQCDLVRVGGRLKKSRLGRHDRHQYLLIEVEYSPAQCCGGVDGMARIT